MQIQLNDSGVYEARWTERHGGQPRSMRKSLRTPIREEAERRLQAFLNGQEIEKKRMTVQDAVQAYTEQHLAPRRREGNLSVSARRAIRKFFKGVAVVDVTDELVREFTKSRANDVAAATVRKELNSLQAALNFVVRRNMVRNIAPFNLPKPAPSEPRDLWMTESQEAFFLRELKAEKMDVQVFARLALAYGCRRQALLDLTWEQVDFERGLIDFNKPGAAQTNKRRAKVPMTDSIRDLLLAHRENSVNFRVIDRNAALWMAKFTARIDMAWVTPHVLKHTAVTLMLRAGVPIGNVAALTATDMRTLISTYRHHCPTELLAAAERRA